MWSGWQGFVVDDTDDQALLSVTSAEQFVTHLSY